MVLGVTGRERGDTCARGSSEGCSNVSAAGHAMSWRNSANTTRSLSSRPKGTGGYVTALGICCHSFWRTGKLWCIEHFGVMRDVLVFDRALTKEMNLLSGLWAREGSDRAFALLERWISKARRA